jgi:hypothetical protein
MTTKPQRKRPEAASVRSTKLKAQREDIFTGAEREAETTTITPPAPKAAAKKPVTFAADVDLMNRARAAVLQSQSQPHGFRSLAAFIEAAVEDKLRTSAAEFNEGKPFEPLEGPFRAGRPFQS